jgi:hypothetical protein
MFGAGRLEPDREAQWGGGYFWSSWGGIALGRRPSSSPGPSGGVSETRISGLAYVAASRLGGVSWRYSAMALIQPSEVPGVLHGAPPHSRYLATGRAWQQRRGTGGFWRAQKAVALRSYLAQFNGRTARLSFWLKSRIIPRNS